MEYRMLQWNSKNLPETSQLTVTSVYRPLQDLVSILNISCSRIFSLLSEN
jgi:hypothetical protein